jgi:hypothetical protein
MDMASCAILMAIDILAVGIMTNDMVVDISVEVQYSCILLMTHSLLLDIEYRGEWTEGKMQASTLLVTDKEPTNGL